MSDRISHTSRRPDEGIALLLVLLFVVLLSVIVVEFSYETQVEASQVGASLQDFEAYSAAKSGISSGLSLLMGDMMGISPTDEQGSTQSAELDQAFQGGTESDSLFEPWASGVAFQEINNAVMRCSIDDEYGKINVNAIVDSRSGETNVVVAEALRVLFITRGAEFDPVDAIIDWVDADDSASPNGAEMDYYMGLDVPYGPKNGPMGSVEELLLIHGVTTDVFFGDPEQNQVPLTELLTVFGDRRGRVNVNTAEPEVLDAIGQAAGMPGLMDLVLSQRETMPFMSSEDLQARGVTLGEQAGGQGQIRNPFIVNTRVFRLYGDGLSGESRVRVEAYVRRYPQSADSPLRLLQWRVIR
ncbi:MAG: hypothetical protein AMXMBFR84_02220 [Candidatus Hydrogenedentota bacterium]